MPRRYHARHVAPLLAAVLLMLAVKALAQDSTSTTPLTPGAWALQFRVGESFTLNSFNGTLLSVKHHSSERTALRLGVSTSLAFQDQEQGHESNVDQEVNRDAQTIGVTLQRLRYTAPSGRFHPFWGLGPTFGWGHSSQHMQSGEVGAGVETESSSTSWAVGLTGNLGIEWCPSANFGLHAEYGVFGGYGHNREESKIDYATLPDPASTFVETSQWRITSEGALLGLSVYF